MMKTNLTKIISSIAIPLMVAGGLYFSTPEYSYAGNNKKQTQEENDLVKKGGPLIKAIDKLSKTGVGQIIDHGRKDVENWAVKQGTGKTLDELEKEAHDAIKSFGQDTSTPPKKEINSYTPSQDKTYKQEPKSSPKTEESIKELDLNREKIIYDLFKNKIEDSELKFEPRTIIVQHGHFTTAKEPEAIVSFYYPTHKTATGNSEVWLVRLINNKWEADRKLGGSHDTDFKTIDIQGDGKLEILIQEGWLNQGCVINKNKLISIDEEINELYSTEGWKYKIEFKNIDKDNVLEIIETEKIESKNHNRTSTKIVETIYDLQGGKYVKIKSSEKLSVESIVRKLNLVYDNCKDYATDALKSCKNVYDTILNFLKDTTSTVTGFFTGKDYIEYNIKKGDTLSGIAKAKTGDWRNWEEIMKYNKRHDNRNFNENLTIGEKVFIPKYMLKK